MKRRPHAKHPIYRVNPQNTFNFGEQLVDNFAGGGGASTGIEMAMGRPVDIAINHDPIAVACHTVNHPNTTHYCESVWDVNPRDVAPAHRIGLAWFSPDCRHFSKAKGAAPVSPRVRGLAWVVLRWMATRKPRVVVLENVEEFQTWGPVVRNDDGDHYPCPRRKGHTFRVFINAMRRQGYTVEWRELRACDYGTPTSRKRLFLIARRDGQPIVWPAPTHGPGLLPYKTAADCIDWSLPCPSIFDRKNPLADATCRRIAAGIMRYVVNNPEPFIVSYYGAKEGEKFRGQGISQPLKTQTTENRFGIVVPTLAPIITEHANASHQRNFSADEPLRTQCAQVKGGHFAVVSAFLAKHYGGVVGHGVEQPLGTVTTVDHHSLVTATLIGAGGSEYSGKPAPVDKPIGTLTTENHKALVTSHLVKLRNNCIGQSVEKPLDTITSNGGHFGEIRAFLIKYYGNESGGININEPMDTIPTRDRFGLVMVRGEPYQIVDIGMRMLEPHELAKAQGFPDDYRLTDLNGKKLSKKDQVRLIGNSVCPPIAAAIVKANMVDVVEEVAA